MTNFVFLEIHDASVRQALAEQLTAKDFLIAPSPNQADFLILDRGDANADYCRKWRSEGMTQPILLLGASLEAARNAGADAGLVKPLRFADLLRQLAQWTSRPSIAVGSFRLDASARQMTNAQGQSLRLTEKETAILSYLAQAGDQAVAREELLGQVWGYAGSATTHTVETHIYRLRRKLQENGGIDLLHTEGGGYRLARP